MYTIFTDGGARGNPGPAGIGAVCYDNGGEVVFEVSKYIGKTTNNQAEYQALIAALNEARSRKIDDVMCYLDSELVVKQLTGLYRVKHPDMKPLYAQVQKLISGIRVTFEHVKREKNKVADMLVNQAIDAYMLQDL